MDNVEVANVSSKREMSRESIKWTRAWQVALQG